MTPDCQKQCRNRLTGLPQFGIEHHPDCPIGEAEKFTLPELLAAIITGMFIASWIAAPIALDKGLPWPLILLTLALPPIILLLTRAVITAIENAADRKD